MKTKENKAPKGNALLVQLTHRAWDRLRKCFRGPPASRNRGSTALGPEPPAQPMNPLSRIHAHLSHHGLSPRVRVRFAAADGDFILEDDDGVVHAKNYDAAVAIIERIWL